MKKSRVRSTLDFFCGYLGLKFKWTYVLLTSSVSRNGALKVFPFLAEAAFGECP